MSAGNTTLLFQTRSQEEIVTVQYFKGRNSLGTADVWRDVIPFIGTYVSKTFIVV